jgi:WD40 repeat protein/serine/threonine protein kinase
MRMSEAGLCLSESEALALVDGELPPERRAEIERHVDGCAACRSLVEVTAHLVSGEPPPAEPAAEPSATGERYTLIGEHARGGQARILLAFDEKLGRQVALKELLPRSEKAEDDSSWRDAMARFLREAELTGQLAHPGVVPVFDVGQRPDGTLYYTMQLIRGRTLSEVLRERASLADRLPLLSHYLNVCQVVAYAHSCGIVHRDLKPQNIMVGEFGETVLLDWGLAKKQSDGPEVMAPTPWAEVSESQTATHVGTAIGTPGYMSPEQASGRLSEVDERSDIYGLGAVLFEILTGQPPPRTSGAPSPRAPDRQAAVPTSVEPRMPDAVSALTALEVGAPPELAAIARKALSADRRDRYQKAADLVQDVTSFMTGGRVAAYTYTSFDLVRRFAVRHRILLGSFCAIFVAVLSALVLTSLAWRSERVSRRLAETSREEAATWAHQALRDGAKLALSQGDVFQARASLRAALEAGDSLSGRAIWWQLREEPLRFIAHLPSAAMAIAYSPDGRELAVATSESGVRLLDASTRKERSLHGGDDKPIAVAYSPDGAFLATGNIEGRLELWDLATGTRIHTGESGGIIGDLAFSPDGTKLAVTGPRAEVHLWNLRPWKLEQKLLGHSAGVKGLSFSPDGRLLASSSLDGTVRLWDLAARSALRTLSAEGAPLRKASFNRDGGLIAAAGQDGGVRIWDSRSGRLWHTLKGHLSIAMDVAFSPDGRWLASNSSDGSVRLWRLPEGKEAQVLNARLGWAYAIAFDPSGSSLAAADERGVAVWSLELLEGKHLRVDDRPTPAERVHRARFSPDGSQIASVDSGGAITLWEAASGIRLANWPSHSGGAATDVAFSPDGRFLASGGSDRSVAIWNLSRQELERRLSYDNSVFAIAYRPDGKRIATVGNDPVVRVWDVFSGKADQSFSSPRSIFARSLAYLRDGALLAVGRQGGSIELWDTRSGRLTRTLSGAESSVRALAADPSRRFLAYAGAQGSVRLWDSADGADRLLGQLDGRVLGIAWGARGDRVAAASSTGEIGYWDLRASEHGRIRAHRGEANSIDFSPDGSLAVTAGDDGTVRLWDAQTWQPRWKTRALVFVPAPQVLTHAGWLGASAASEIVSVTPEPTAWRSAVERSWSAAMIPSGPLCLATEAGLEIWDVRRDARRQSEPLSQVFELVPLQEGCATLSAGTVALHRPGQPSFVVASGATRAAGGEVLVVVGPQVDSYDLSGRHLTSFGPGAGVTAVAVLGDRLALGFSNGAIELRMPEGSAGTLPTFVDTLAGSITSLAAGPQGTLIAGYADGSFGIWDSASGERLKLAAVHGPVDRLSVQGNLLLAVSELGSASAIDLYPLTRDYRDLMREVRPGGGAATDPTRLTPRSTPPRATNERAAPTPPGQTDPVESPPSYGHAGAPSLSKP